MCVGGAEHKMIAQVFKEAVLMEPAQCASQCKERKGCSRDFVKEMTRSEMERMSSEQKSCVKFSRGAQTYIGASYC